MSHVLKVCRVETVAGSALAAAAGAQYIGLHVLNATIFSERKKELFIQIVKYVKDNKLPCEPVLLFNCDDPHFIASASTIIGCANLQLHVTGANPAFAQNLSTLFQERGLPQLRIIKLISQKNKGIKISEEDCFAELRAWLPFSYGILVDSDAVGGTGTTADWNFAQRIFNASGRAKTFLAGGLNHVNIHSAIKHSQACGVDLQSSLEIRDSLGRKRKDVTKVILSAAAANNISLKSLNRSYIKRRSIPQLLFSPSDLEAGAVAILASLAEENIDGVQIDTSDGTTEVAASRWSKSAPEWADICWKTAPELPLWLHCFSTHVIWIRKQCEDVLKVNPHCVGVFIQTNSPEITLDVCATLRATLPITVIPSMSTSEALQMNVLLMRSSSVWQLTCANSFLNRVTKANEAVSKLRSAGIRVHLDRGVTVDLLKSLSILPDCVTMGRGFINMSIPISEVRSFVNNTAK